MTDQQSYGPPPDAIPLSNAMKEFLPAEMWEEYERAVEVRKNTPRRPAYIFSSVREWEAANTSYRAVNRTRSARDEPLRIWNRILAAFKAKLEAGELLAFGQEDPPFGPWREIPAAAWRQLRISNVRKGQASVGATIVHDIHILAPEAEEHMPTGMPGRPSSGKEIIEVEFRRRVAAGDIESSLAAQCRVLEGWYRENHPRQRCPTAKTIENNLRSAWRAVHQRTA